MMIKRKDVTRQLDFVNKIRESCLLTIESKVFLINYELQARSKHERNPSVMIKEAHHGRQIFL